MADSHDDTSPPQTVRWRGGGFAIVPNALIETLPDCIQVFAALAKYADREGRCFPGLDTLADMLGVSVSTIYRRIGKLEKAGWVSVVRRGSMQSNVYYLHSVASDRSDLTGHDRSRVTGHDRSPVTDEQEPEETTTPSNGKPDTTSSSKRPRDARPVPKSQSLVGESRQAKRRKLRDQRSGKTPRGEAGTVIPSKPAKESPGDILRRMIREGKV